jgi:tripartite-type tricarboxylate transporter receptor subunit TctC
MDFVIPYPPGGSVDPSGREFTSLFTEIHGFGFRLENVPGAGGTVGAAQTITSPADGYSLGIAVNTGLAFQPLTNPDLPWRTADDYTPLGSLGSAPSVFFVRADSPWQNFADLLAFARTNPGQVTVSTPGAFTIGDLTTEQLNLAAGVEFVAVNVGGAGEAVAAALGGQVTGYSGTFSSARGQFNDGELRALVVFASEPYEPLPGVPLITELVPGIEPAGFELHLIAPLIDDPALIARLDELIQAVVLDPRYVEWQVSQGLTPHRSNSAEARERLARDQRNFEAVLDSLKARGRA